MSEDNISVVKVGPYFYRIRPMPDAMKDRYEGLTEAEKSIIYLRTDLPHERREVTYWHELLHALFDVISTGLEHDQAERIIDSLAPALVQLMDDNAHIRWGWMEDRPPYGDDGDLPPEGPPSLRVIIGGGEGSA